MKRQLGLTLILAALSGCGGLASVQLPGGAAYSDDGQYLPPPPGPGLIVNADSLIPDVPTPIGFKPLADRSYNHSTQVARDLKYWFQGQGQLAEAELFYRRELAEHHWRFLSREDAPDGSVVLRFTKAPEALRVRLAQTHAVTTIVITIHPKPPATRAIP